MDAESAMVLPISVHTHPMELLCWKSPGRTKQAVKQRFADCHSMPVLWYSPLDEELGEPISE